MSVAFGPEGKAVLTGSYDNPVKGTARVWDATFRLPSPDFFEARWPGLGRRLQPRREDRSHRQRGSHGEALGRNLRSSHH